MLIEITRRCNEMCKHCMVTALPDGENMTFATFTKAINFALYNKIRVISISGGEPTLHPSFGKMMNLLFTLTKDKQVAIVLESNGWWIEDEKWCERIKRILDNPQVFGLQISTNKKYYPNYERIMSHESDFTNLHPKVKFTHDWQGVDTHLRYMGRATLLMKKSDATGLPNCMNWVSYALNLNNLGVPKLQQNIHTLSEFALLRAKTCSPYVQYNGKVTICEGDLIPSLIDLKDWYAHTAQKLSEELFQKILSFVPCNKCGTFKNMTQEQCKTFDSYRQQYGLEPKFEKAWLALKENIETKDL